MIKKEDVKVGKFVNANAAISFDSNGWSNMNKCTMPSGSVFYVPSFDNLIFKITDVSEESVVVEPVYDVYLMNGYELIRINKYLYSTKDFTRDFTIVLTEDTEMICDVINKKRPKQCAFNQVNHPSHYAYLKDLCGVEPLDICQHLDFCCGSAIKYILRRGKEEKNLTEKQQRIQDLEKAKVYIETEIKLLKDGKD